MEAEKTKSTDEKYKINKWIFRVFYVMLLALLATTVFYKYHGRMNYFECNNPGPIFTGTDKMEGCKNPFYTPLTWENEEWLPPGTYGIDPRPDIENLTLIAFGGLGMCLVANHWLYNHKFSIKKFINKHMEKEDDEND